MKFVVELDDAQLESLASLLAAKLTPDRSGVSPSDPLITARDAGVPARTWRRNKDELRAVMVGRELRAKRSDVDRWLARLAEPAKLAPVAANTPGDEADDELAELLQMGRLRVIK